MILYQNKLCSVLGNRISDSTIFRFPMNLYWLWGRIKKLTTSNYLQSLKMKFSHRFFVSIKISLRSQRIYKDSKLTSIIGLESVSQLSWKWLPALWINWIQQAINCWPVIISRISKDWLVSFWLFNYVWFMFSSVLFQ